jgi:UDP-glucose 4-epimerase
MMKILVTGGTGFIGSHATVVLQQAGYEVVIVDSLVNSRVEVLDSIEKITGIKPGFFQFDLADRRKTLDFFSSNPDIAGVMHFAALKAVGESVEKPLHYYRNNLDSLINILDGMTAAGINKLVFSSSCTVYGQPERLPVTEFTAVLPAASPYGNTKQISEEIIADMVAAPGNDLQCISLRYFNPIGAHESALIGELPIGRPNNLVPYLTQTAIGKLDCLNVFGSDYNTPDGTAIRDYIHVVDLAGAHLVALDRLLQQKTKASYEVFNLGTGRGFSVLEIISSFEKVSGIKLNYRLTGRRAGDIEKIWADVTLANTELGWSAERNLDEMMLSAWNWEKHLARLNETT